MNISVKEKVVVVTGATGLIGGAMAKAFSEHGAFVAVCDLNKEKCDAKAKELGIPVITEEELLQMIGGKE